MKRRDFLASSLGLLATTALPGCEDQAEANLPRPPAPGVGPDGKRRIPWQNWSGYQHCLPDARLAPASLDELADFLRKAKGPVRPVGAGHSFTPLVPTDGAIVSLRNFTGVLAHDAAAMTAAIGAGTKLGDLGEPLHQAGQALPNMPDVDEQSLAGAISTGTHGTGQALGALHSYVTELQLVTPRGEVIECGRAKRPETFDAARVSLGSLGVITRVTLQNVPSHNLKRRLWVEPMDALMERYDDLVARHHSLDMYYVPFADFGIAITIDPTDEPMRPRGAEPDTEFVQDLRHARDLTAWWPKARRWLLNRPAESFEPEEAVDIWYRIFPSSRTVRFNEMEYHLPREQLMPTLRRVRETLESRHREIAFPIEIRTVKGDDAWLSPFTGHEVSGSIAVHQYHDEDPLPYFASIEPLFRAAGGRPHWGKMHTLRAAELAPRYPRWQDFLRVRAQLDPGGKMLNPYLKGVFGL